MTPEKLLLSLSEEQREPAARVHEALTVRGLFCAVIEQDKGHQIRYSAKGFALDINAEGVSFRGKYDIRAFLKLYRETGDEALRAMLFEAAMPCDYCIGDKCTTLLMEPHRTIRYDGRSKKLCAVCFHPKNRLTLPVTNRTAENVLAVIDMMFAYPPEKITVGDANQVTYTVTGRPALTVLGLRHVQNALSVSTEEFIKNCLEQDAQGRRKIDAVLRAAGQEGAARFMGVTANFIHGGSYDFILGVPCENPPNPLPEGVVRVKIHGGDWVVYNSSENNYESIWRHYTDRFYKETKLGFDAARPPFEYYDDAGRFSDVHIPVDADAGPDAGRFVRLEWTPDILMAGYGDFAEPDYPLHTPIPPDARERLAASFPQAERFVQDDTHSIFGKPHRFAIGVETAPDTPVPPDMKHIRLKGGYWYRMGHRHFNGGSYDYAISWKFFESHLTMDDLAHPRSFVCYNYRCRGGYAVTDVPVRLRGEIAYEPVTLPPQRVIGRLEAPPESVIPDEEIAALYDMPHNAQPGTLVIGFHWKIINNWNYFDRPLVKGVFVSGDAEAPEGHAAYTLEGGAYMKVTESIPNGEPGWAMEYVIREDLEAKTGQKPDLSRQIQVVQHEHGRYYTLYVPV